MKSTLDGVSSYKISTVERNDVKNTAVAPSAEKGSLLLDVIDLFLGWHQQGRNVIS